MRPVILLAEDDVVIRNLLRFLLEGDSFEVMVASNGLEALELSRASDREVSLFLSDLEMPVMDGISAYRQLQIEQPSVKVLFMSGGYSERDLPEPWPFLAKPFVVKDLLKMVGELTAARTSA